MSKLLLRKKFLESNRKIHSAKTWVQAWNFYEEAHIWSYKNWNQLKKIPSIKAIRPSKVLYKAFLKSWCKYQIYSPYECIYNNEPDY